MAAAVDRVRCANKGYQWSWVGFLLIATHIGLSTEQFDGFNCTDVCASLRSASSSNWSYLTLVANSTDSGATLSFCNESGTTTNLGAPNGTEEIDIGMCSGVYAEDYMGVRVARASLNVSVLPIKDSACMRACAICKVDLRCSFSYESGSTCNNVTQEQVVSCTRRKLGVFQSEAELNATTISNINVSYANYSSVIKRVVPDVLIAAGSKNTCLVSTHGMVIHAACQCAPS